MGVVAIKNLKKSTEEKECYEQFTVPNEVVEYIRHLESGIKYNRIGGLRNWYPKLNYRDYSNDASMSPDAKEVQEIDIDFGGPEVEMIRGDRVNYAVRAETEEDLIEDFQALAIEQLEKSEIRRL